MSVWTTVADRIGIGPATDVLDVGCGSGRFCALAAARGATVHGVDASPLEIDHARARVPAGEFRVGFMEDLPWPDDSFDAVTGFNSFQYALDVDLALSEARRVARPGAALAICKWAPPEDNDFFALLIALGARRPTGRDPIDDAIRRARLDVVADGDVSAPMEMPDEAALDAALRAAGLVVDRPGLRAPAAPFLRPDGSYRFENRLRYLIIS
jgi:SAM-dependent methyltransferase